mmetsp:Transcript_27777/g.26587  ORF Transcript_27777/g.26587 Transcript_27777/m.26587 type:complete len:242 (+) Transcript_27777:372-1097(+)
MAAYLISDYYESESIGQHFQNRESIAVSFLMAMGSKALALTELSETVSISGLDYEAKCAHELIRYRFRMRLCEVGLLVNKRARNGQLRILPIKLQCSKQGDHLEWQSNKIFGGKKMFSLNNLISIQSSERVDIRGNGELSPEIPGTPKSETPTTSMIRKLSLSSRSASVTSFLSVTSATLKRVESENTITKNNGSIPFITLINSTRKLNLRFQTEYETLVYIDLIRHNYITNSSISSSPVA